MSQAAGEEQFGRFRVWGLGVLRLFRGFHNLTLPTIQILHTYIYFQNACA